MIPAIANNRFLHRVNPHIQRTLTAGGSSLAHPEIQQSMRQMVDLGIAGNLSLWAHSGLTKGRVSSPDTFVTDAYDISGSNIDAAQTTTASQPKLLSPGMQFDGTDDFLSFGTNSILRATNNISVFMWVKIPNLQNTRYIISRWNGAGSRSWGINLQTTGVLRVVSSHNNSTLQTLIGVTNVSNNAWHHVGFTFDSGAMVLYVNGQSDNSRTDLVSYFSTNTEPFIIARLANAVGWAACTTEDIRYFTTSILTADQVLAIYNETKATYGY